MNWLVDNWAILLPLAISVVASLANVLTMHPELAGGKWTKVALFALDLLSLFQSGGSVRGKGIPAKLPLVQLSPPPTPIAKRLADIARPQ